MDRSAVTPSAHTAKSWTAAGGRCRVYRAEHPSRLHTPHRHILLHPSKLEPIAEDLSIEMLHSTSIPLLALLAGTRLISGAEVANEGPSARPAAANVSALEGRQNQREYNLQIGYEGASFFDGWEFFTQPDPSWGCESYASVLGISLQHDLEGPCAGFSGLADAWARLSGSRE